MLFPLNNLHGFSGTFDYLRGCFIVYHEPGKDKLYDNSSCGPDGVLAVLLKKSKYFVAVPLSLLWNVSIEL